MKKKIAITLLFVVLVLAGKYVYDVNINHNFGTITDGKVYKSGVIPPDQLADYIEKYDIKSVVDLRFPGTADVINNPEIPEQLIAEQEAIAKLDGINYYNVGSRQVPDEPTLDRFFKVMDDSTNYPVLIHCYHGAGRAQLFSSLYRIEYEGMSNEDARSKTRALVTFSSFDDGKPKGEFLKNYQTRNSNN
jgi:protein tyrosine/serine phosphatase